MNRSDAKKIAETISNQKIQEMFDNAKSRVKNWKKVSDVNKGITKGLAWNILARNFDVNQNYDILAKTNMIREFGEFLPDELKIKKQEKKNKIKPTHQDPIL